MTTTPVEMVSEHPFEAAGLGRAPFRCLGVFQLPSQALAGQNPEAYNNALRMMPRGFGCGTCAFCGIGIMNNYLIRSADGRTFAVGCDCVAKTADGKLITKVEAEQRRIERERRRAKAADARQVWADARRAKAQTARAEQDAREAAEAAKREAARGACTAANQWLIAALRKNTYSRFCDEIATALETRTVAEMSFTPRAVAILRDIYSKDAGRRGSKKSLAAIADFDSKMGAVDGQ